jgi:hypothetical protein
LLGTAAGHNRSVAKVGFAVAKLLHPEVPMNISANSFRDKAISFFSISYDWESGTHIADIAVRSVDGMVDRYRIKQLSELNVSEDFGSQHIVFCSLIASPGRMYLSLDPFTEGVESDRDNFTFLGSEIMKLDQEANA